MSAGDVTEGSPVERAVFTVLILAAVYGLSRQKINWAALAGDNPWLVTLVFYCGLSILWSDHSDVALKRWIKLIGGFAIALSIAVHSDAVGAMKIVIKRCAYILIPLSVVLVKYYPQFGRGYNDWTGQVDYTGVTGNKNTLGYLCLICGLFLLWDILNHRFDEGRAGTKLERLMELSVFAGTLWLLVISGSMTSLVGFTIGAALLLLFFKSGLRPRVVLVLVMISVVGMLLLQSLVDIYGFVLESVGRDRTLTDRTDLWADLIKLTDNPIWGAGFGSFWLGERLEFLWNKHSWTPNQAHNGYLEVYINLGWVGLLIIGAVTLAAYRRVSRALACRAKDGSLLFVLLIVVLLFNYTEAAFLRPHFMWVLFLFIAIEAARSSSELTPLLWTRGQTVGQGCK